MSSRNLNRFQNSMNCPFKRIELNCLSPLTDQNMESVFPEIEPKNNNKKVWNENLVCEPEQHTNKKEKEIK